MLNQLEASVRGLESYYTSLIQRDIATYVNLNWIQIARTLYFHNSILATLVPGATLRYLAKLKRLLRTALCNAAKYSIPQRAYLHSYT